MTMTEKLHCIFDHFAILYFIILPQSTLLDGNFVHICNNEIRIDLERQKSLRIKKYGEGNKQISLLHNLPVSSSGGNV